MGYQMARWDEVTDDELDIGEYTGGSFDKEFFQVFGLLALIVVGGSLWLWLAFGGDREGMAWEQVRSIPGATNIEMLQQHDCYSAMTEAYSNDGFEFHYVRKGSGYSINYCCSGMGCSVRR